jgi:hypothetical protein
MRLGETCRDNVKLKELMKLTSVNRRLLINSKASIVEVRRQYPALFTLDGIVGDYADLIMSTDHQLLHALRKNLFTCCASIMTLSEQVSKGKTKSAKQFQSKCSYLRCSLKFVFFHFSLVWSYSELFSITDFFIQGFITDVVMYNGQFQRKILKMCWY